MRQRQQDVGVFRAVVSVADLALERDASRRALGRPRTQECRDEQHEDDGVEHFGAEESGIETDECNRQRRCGLADGEAEDDVTLVRRVSLNLGDEPRCGSFAEDHHDDDERGDLQRLRSVEDHARIDEHADVQEEERDEKGVSDELDAVHQRTALWDHLIECDPGDERPQNAGEIE